MKVPLLDLKVQYELLADELKRSVLEVLESTTYILGPQVAEFERVVADYIGIRYTIGVSSGSDALLVALMALGIERDDLVLTSPYSFFATAGAIARLGAKPVFVDVERETFNLSAQAAGEWFEEHRTEAHRVRAIMPVHLFGQCADMKPLVTLAARHDIPVVEDAAQAIGAKYPWDGSLHSAGSMGSVGCFSFFPSKNLGGIGDGGLVATNDQSLAEKMHILRDHGASPKYYHRVIGGNFRLDTVQAAVLLVKLKYLEGWHEKRRLNARYYHDNLQCAAVCKPLEVHGKGMHIYNQYVITVRERRDELKDFLAQNGVSSEIYYPVPLHLQECFRYLGYRAGALPVAEELAKHSLALPVYPELTSKMQDYVIGKIREFYV